MRFTEPVAVVVQRVSFDSPFHDLIRRVRLAFPRAPVEVITTADATPSTFRDLFKAHSCSHMVRVIGNCAALDVGLTRRMAKRAVTDKADYLYPLRFPLGFLPSEIFSRRALERAARSDGEHPYAFKQLRRTKSERLNIRSFRFENEIKSSRLIRLYAHRSLYPAFAVTTPEDAKFIRDVHRRMGRLQETLQDYLRFCTPFRRVLALYRRHYPGHLFGIPSAVGEPAGDTYPAWWKTVRREKLNPFCGVGAPVPAWRNRKIWHGWVDGKSESKFILDTLKATRATSILDVGCGLGRLAPAMVSRVASYTGVDSSKEAITLARRRLRGTKAVFRTTDDNLIPFEDNSFDAAFAWQVFVHMERADLLDTLRELFRVLKPGGRLLFTLERLEISFAAWINHQAKNLGPWKVLRRYEPRVESEVRILLQEAGFDRIRVDGKLYLCSVASG